jgi:hypothetical protein
MTLTKQLHKHNACSDAIKWIESNSITTLAQAWDKCQRPDWMLWLNDKEIITIDDRTLRLFACRCVKETPIGDGRTVWDLLTDDRSRNAVEVAERYANGDATDDELTSAMYAASTAAWDAASAAARTAARAAALDGARYEAMYAASTAAWDAAMYAAEDEARDSARVFQADLLREMVGNPFKK